MTTKDKGIFKQPTNSSKNMGQFQGVGLPTKYGIKQQAPSKKSPLHLSKGAPPLTLS